MDPPPPARRRPGHGPPWLLLPLLLFLTAFYAYPVGAMLARGVHDGGWTLEPFAALLGDASFWRVMRITAVVSLVVTLACLGLGYPVAFLLARLPRGTANLLLVLVLIPFWTSILVRTYAWMAILGRRGLVNDALIGLGLTERPVQLLNTRLAVYVAMTHVLLPFMILPLYAALRDLDWRLVRAAGSLGAGPLATFRRVVLPLSLPGVAAGCVLVFTLAVGFFITPVLVGGTSDIMISILINNEVTQLDWPRAAAMSTVLLGVVLASFLALAKVAPVGRVLGGGRR